MKAVCRDTFLGFFFKAKNMDVERARDSNNDFPLSSLVGSLSRVDTKKRLWGAEESLIKIKSFKRVFFFEKKNIWIGESLAGGFDEKIRYSKDIWLS